MLSYSGTFSILCVEIGGGSVARAPVLGMQLQASSEPRFYHREMRMVKGNHGIVGWGYTDGNEFLELRIAADGQLVPRGLDAAVSVSLTRSLALSCACFLSCLRVDHESWPRRPAATSVTVSAA